MNRLRILVPVVAAVVISGCSDDGTFSPEAVGDDVRITVIGTVVSSVGLVPVSDASVWVDLETVEGGASRASARTDETGRFSMQFVERDCSLATERAFRVFARKKGFADAELSADGNGGQPVLRCTVREQVVDLHLGDG